MNIQCRKNEDENFEEYGKRKIRKFGVTRRVPTRKAFQSHVAARRTVVNFISEHAGLRPTSNAHNLR
jgi:hypothetical protein